MFFFHELMQLIYIKLCFSDLRGEACFRCVALGTNLALEESQRAHDPKRFMSKGLIVSEYFFVPRKKFDKFLL